MEAAGASNHWSSASTPAAQRFDAWCESLSLTHLEWSVGARRVRDYHAEVHESALGAARVVRCACDPLDGRRERGEIARTSGAYFGVLLVMRGEETVSAGDGAARLGAGDLALWDSERPCAFSVHERLEKISLIVPKARLDRVVPDAEQYVGRIAGVRSAAGALAVDQLVSLARHAPRIGEGASERVLDASLELLGAAFGAVAPAPSRTARIRGWIEARLEDPALSPTNIASAHGLSVRTLHAWFQAEGLSLSRWMLATRLERCRRDLLRRDGTPITEIAFRWGFRDAAHFSRAFKRAFGRPPRAIRDLP